MSFRGHAYRQHGSAGPRLSSPSISRLQLRGQPVPPAEECLRRLPGTFAKFTKDGYNGIVACAIIRRRIPSMLYLRPRWVRSGLVRSSSTPVVTPGFVISSSRGTGQASGCRSASCAACRLIVLDTGSNGRLRDNRCWLRAPLKSYQTAQLYRNRLKVRDIYFKTLSEIGFSYVRTRKRQERAVSYTKLSPDVSFVEAAGTAFETREVQLRPVFK